MESKNEDLQVDEYKNITNNIASITDNFMSQTSICNKFFDSTYNSKLDKSCIFYC